MPENLIDPRAPDARDDALVAQQRVQRAWSVEQLFQLARPRAGVGPGLGTELGQRFVVLELAGAQELDPGGLL